MTKVHVLVEGQSEETFVTKVLGPHLAGLEIFLTPVIIQTKRVKSGLKFKGGINRFEPVQRDLQRLLADTSAKAVTTMIDFYGLPEEFPGLSSLPRNASCHQRVEHMEASWRETVDHLRFRPYLSLHEFEALVLVSPREIKTVFPEGRGVAQLAEMQFPSPEEVNDGPDTHPAARILSQVPAYRKTLHGPLVVERIGLAPLRRSCPHFNEWVTWLESLS